MHKCIMVKVGRKRNTRKVCKKQVNLSKTEGKFVKVGGNYNFRETGRKCTETAKIGGKFKICGRWLKKRSSEISADENQEIFQEKVKFVKFSSEPENFSKIGGKSETEGEMHYGLRGDGRPCMHACVYVWRMTLSMSKRKQNSWFVVRKYLRFTGKLDLAKWVVF